MTEKYKVIANKKYGDLNNDEGFKKTYKINSIINNISYDKPHIEIKFLEGFSLIISFGEKYPLQSPTITLKCIPEIYDYDCEKIIEINDYKSNFTIKDIVQKVFEEITPILKVHKNMYEHNKKTIEKLKNKGGELKMVIGAGNIDQPYAKDDGEDLTNFKDIYDVGITQERREIELTMDDFSPIYLKIGNNDATKLITTQLENLFSVIIFDLDVIKFFDKNDGIYLLVKMLKPNDGKLYIDEPFNIPTYINNGNILTNIVNDYKGSNDGSLFRIKLKLCPLKGAEELEPEITKANNSINQFINQNNKLYFENKYKDSDYNINFKIIEKGTYPLYKMAYHKDGFPDKTYYEITKYKKNNPIEKLIYDIHQLLIRKQMIEDLILV